DARGPVDAGPSLDAFAPPLDAAGLDAPGLDAFVGDDAALSPDAGTDAPVLDAATYPPIYYPVTTHTVVQDVTMIALAPMQAIADAAFTITPALPDGMTFDADTGAIGGRPTGVSAAAVYRVVANAPSGTYVRDLTLAVRTGAPSDLAYTFASPTYVIGEAIETNAPAYVGARATFSVAPTLPAGLRLGSTTGYITGTPTAAAGTTSHVITATNAYGIMTRTLRITLATTAPRRVVIAELVPADSAPSAMFPGIHAEAMGMTPRVTVGFQVPFPWLVDPCDLGSFGLTEDGTGLVMRIQDGCVWQQNYETDYTYARTELGLLRSYDGGVFPAGVATTIEWRGYFTQPLPPVGRRDVMVAPFQLHNNNGGSPMFAFAVNTRTGNVELHITTPPPTTMLERAVTIAPYASFVGTARTLTMTVVPAETETGSISVSLDGTVIYEETDRMTSVTPGEDYLKFGLYDWGRGFVEPSTPERGRVFEMVTELVRVTR
ncbi:MAG: putative Ig domain-containing protein, partial [Deltaproteobacteria bacterium]|nr:putative Ig domain-containing protein [Deltaproteobacteria bacterium]